jgi:hypothetical protein
LPRQPGEGDRLDPIRVRPQRRRGVDPALGQATAQALEQVQIVCAAAADIEFIRLRAALLYGAGDRARAELGKPGLNILCC